MEFTGPTVYSYFDKWDTDNALKEWCLITLHKEDQTVKIFKFSPEEWFIMLLPENAFLAQKEWMTNTLRKPYIMKTRIQCL